MAKSTPVKKAWRSLTWLGVIVVVLLGTLTAGVLFSNATWLPKLALDLEGGTQIILAPQVENGQTVQQQQLDQAVSIIRQRIDASGVSEAQISTEGSRNIVVSLPGKPDQQTLDRCRPAARPTRSWAPTASRHRRPAPRLAFSRRRRPSRRTAATSPG